MVKRKVPTRTKLWQLADGRIVKGCRQLGCYSATLGAFCATHAAILAPQPIENITRPTKAVTT